MEKLNNWSNPKNITIKMKRLFQVATLNRQVVNSTPWDHWIILSYGHDQDPLSTEISLLYPFPV